MRKNKNNVIKKNAMPPKARKFMKVWICLVLMLLMVSVCAVTAFAAEDDPVEVVNNLSDFMFGIVRAVGMIMLGFAVVQCSLSNRTTAWVGFTILIILISAPIKPSVPCIGFPVGL